MTEAVDPEPGGTVLVIGAAGAVGSAAAQLGRLRGLWVVGTAGGAAKLRHLLDDLGLEAASTTRRRTPTAGAFPRMFMGRSVGKPEARIA